LEAFSDGVLAIIITIMVLELKTPHSPEPAALKPLIPVFLSYVLSFMYVGIYWNNHHHMLQGSQRVSGGTLWANLHLLFWLSLIPFSTAWMGETHFASLPVAVYGITLLLCALSWWILQQALVRVHGKESLLAHAFGKNLKGNLSLLLYLVAIPLAFWHRWVAGCIYVFVALMWLVPDKRIEREMKHDRGQSTQP